MLEAQKAPILTERQVGGVTPSPSYSQGHPKGHQPNKPSFPGPKAVGSSSYGVRRRGVGWGYLIAPPPRPPGQPQPFVPGVRPTKTSSEAPLDCGAGKGSHGLRVWESSWDAEEHFGIAQDIEGMGCLEDEEKAWKRQESRQSKKEQTLENRGIQDAKDWCNMYRAGWSLHWAAHGLHLTSAVCPVADSAPFLTTFSVQGLYPVVCKGVSVPAAGVGPLVTWAHVPGSKLTGLLEGLPDCWRRLDTRFMPLTPTDGPPIACNTPLQCCNKHF